MEVCAEAERAPIVMKVIKLSRAGLRDSGDVFSGPFGFYVGAFQSVLRVLVYREAR